MKVIYKSPTTLTATGNKAVIQIELQLDKGDRITFLAVFSDRKILGSIKNQQGIPAGLHPIELDFNGSDEADHSISFVAFYSKTDTDIQDEPVYESKNVKIQVAGLQLPEWARYAPAFAISDFSPTITNNQLPLIRMKLQLFVVRDKEKYSFKEKGIDNTTAISAFINGTNVSEEIRFDGEYLTILSLQALKDGVNRIDVSIKFERYNKRVSLSEELIFKKKAPVLQPKKTIVFTNRLFPSFEIGISDTIAVGNLKGLQVVMGEYAVDFKATSITTGNEGRSLTVQIDLKKELWQGTHAVGVCMTDGAGNKSETVIQQIFIDNKPPDVFQQTPPLRSVINARDPEFVFNVKDNPDPRLLDLPVNLLRGPGTIKANLFAHAGIYTIRDLVRLNTTEQNVRGITPHELQRNIQKALIIANLSIDPVLYKNLLNLPLRLVLDSTVKQLCDQSGLSEKDIRQLKNLLNPLHLSLDTSIINRSFVAQVALIKGSGADTFQLWLDQTDVSAKAVLSNNEIVYQHKGILDQGIHYIQLKVTDKCGNTNTYYNYFTADKDGPKFFDEYPKNESFINDTPLTLSVKYQDQFSGIDAASVRVYLNDNKADPESVKISESGVSYNRKRLTEGQYQFRVEVSDKAGNQSVHVSRFTYDLTPPEVTFSPDQNLTATHEDRLEIRGIVSEKVKSIQVNGVQATQARDFSFAAQVPLMQNGWNSIQAEVKDMSGNTRISNPISVYKVGMHDIAVYGKVLDSNEAGVAGARVYVKKTNSWTVTDLKGKFCLYTNPLLSGKNLVEVTQPVNHAEPLQSFKMEVVLGKGKAHSFGNFYLIKSKLSDGKPIQKNQQGYTDLKLEGTANIALPNMNLEFPKDAERKVAISEVPANQIPVKLPGGTKPEQIISLEPEGLTINSSEGAQLNFQSKRELKPGMIVPVFSYSHLTGKWSLGAIAKVGADKKTISTLPGQGIRHFSLWTPMMPSLKIEVLVEDVRIPTRSELVPPITSEILLPEISKGTSVLKPKMVYNSRAARPQVTFVSIFKGLEEVVSVEKIGPITQGDSKQIVKALVDVQNYFVSKQKKCNWGALFVGIGLAILFPPLALVFFGFLLVTGGLTYDEIEQGSFQTESETLYLPFGEFDPYQIDPSVQTIESEDHITRTVRNVLASPIEVYRIKKEITTDITRTFWPGKIHHRYFMGFTKQEEWQTHEGTATAKGKDNREIPVLNANETLRHTLPATYTDPYSEESRYYPSGVQDFISMFRLEGAEYETSQTNSVIVEFNQDLEYLENLRGKIRELKRKHQLSDMESQKLPEMENEVTMLEATNNIYTSGTVLKEEDRKWNGPAEIFSKSTAGTAVIEDLNNSPFGKGWGLANQQRICQLNLTRALVINGKEKIVFNAVTETIDTWWKDTTDKNIITATDRLERSVFCFWNYESNAVQKKALVFARGAKIFKVEYQSDGTYHFDTPVLLLELPVFSKKVVVIRRYPEMQPRTEMVTAGYTEKYLLPISKWRLVWDGWWPSYVETWGYRDIPPVFQTVSRRTGNWVSPVELSSSSSTVIKPDITSVISDPDGNLYASDANSHRIFKINSSGQYEIICGRVDHDDPAPSASGGTDYQDTTTITSWKTATTLTQDGAVAKDASINCPTGLAIDQNGDLVFAEKGNHMIRKIKGGKLKTIGGNGEAIYKRPSVGDDGELPIASTIALSSPASIRVDSSGNIYCLLNVSGDHFVVVKLDFFTNMEGESFWRARHVLGSGIGGTISAGIEEAFSITFASDIEIDGAGRLYVYTSARIIVHSGGLIDVFAGTNNQQEKPNNGDGGPAVEARLTTGGYMRQNSDGNFLILDPGNRSIRQITRTALGSGSIRLEGPGGYTESYLMKTMADEWVRTYSNGRQVIFRSDNGFVDREIDNGNTILYKYTSDGKLFRIEYDSSRFIEFIYNDDSKIRQSRDHLGKITNFVYDGNFNLKQIRLPDKTLNFEYDDDGILIP